MIIDRFPGYQPDPAIATKKRKPRSTPALVGLFSQLLSQQRFHQLRPYLQGSVLDIGCGRANLLEHISPEQEYVGVDRDANIFQWLLKNHPAREFHLLNLNKQNLALGRKFDTIVMAATIEYFTQPQKVLLQAGAHLNPGGKLLITTRTPLSDRIICFGARFGISAQRSGKNPITVFTYLALKILFKDCGFGVEKHQVFLLGSNQFFVCSSLDKGNLQVLPQ